jgi:hypothetical protein
MRAVKDPTREDYRTLVTEALGVDREAVRAWDCAAGRIRVEVEINTGITIAMLQKLSTTLGTDQINIEPAQPGEYYSESTWDDGYPAKIVAECDAGEWSATVDCPECDDGFADHPGCPACRMPKHMGHAKGCPRTPHVLSQDSEKTAKGNER